MMKLTTLLLFAALLQLHAAGNAQTVTYAAKSVTIEQVFSVLSEQTGYLFFYNKHDLDDSQKVDVNFRAMPLKEALDAVFKGKQLEVVIEKKSVFIKRKANTAAGFIVPEAFLPPADSTITVTGKVVNTRGEPVATAAVKVKNGTQGAVTDMNGFFVIHKVPKNASLTISNIAYQTYETGVNGRGVLGLITLQEYIRPLDEMQVIAYGTTTRRISTSNISKLSSEEIAKQPVLNLAQALEGRIPGLVASQTTGVPGARVSVQVRGRNNFDNTLSSDQPLFIVDGVPMASGNDRVNDNLGPFGPATTDGLTALAGINTTDIESISVLKDADATAIYGSRGANGVILITTKKGRAGKMKVDANFYTGINSVSRLPEMMNTKEYVQMRREALKNDNLTPTATNAYDILLWDTTRYTDFARLLVGNKAAVYDGQLTLSGGDRNTTYRVGGGYHKEGTVWPGNETSQRASLNFNLHSMSANEKFTMDLSGIYSVSRSNLVAGDLASAVALPPNFRVYDSTGKLAWNESGIYDGKDNPMALINLKYLSVMNNLNANMVLNYKLTRDLVLRSSFGYNTTVTDDKRLQPSSSQNPLKSGTNTISLIGNTNFKNWIAEPQVQYNHRLGRGKLDLLAGSTFSSRENTSFTGRGVGYSGDELLGSLAAATTMTVSNTSAQYHYQAFFGRVNYNVNDKYIVNLTGRRDGSSRFGPGARFSDFGAAGAAWVFSNEEVLKNNTVLSYGKLRGSYGITGNDQIADYSYLDSYTSGSTYGDSSTLAPAKLYSPDLHWEKNTKSEVAVELGFMKDKLLVSVSFYRNIISSPLVSYPLPRTTGFASVVSNLDGVKLQNKGVEVTVSSRNILSKNFRWTTDFNISLPKNTLKAYPNLASSSYASKYGIGESLNRIYGLQYAGVDPVTGSYTVKDVNKDGVASSADYGAAGNTDPKFFGGLNNSFTYKRLNFSFFFQFTRQMGRDWRMAQTYIMPGGMYNFPTLALSRWQTAGQVTDVQKYTTQTGAITGLTGTYAFSLSNAGYTDASFVRLKNVAVSYDLPVQWMSAAHFTAAKVYFQAQNLFVLTGYKGGDPEVQAYTRMAPLRTVTAGVQLSF